jgi:hypothetical protein
MTFHFPTNPSAGDTAVGPIGQVWRFNGKAWTGGGSIVHGPNGPKGGLGPLGVAQPFVGPDPPSNPEPDMLWWDNSTGGLFIWLEEHAWVQILSSGLQGPEGNVGPAGVVGGSSPTVGAVRPANPNNGDFWFRTTDGVLAVWSELNGQWIGIG